MLGGKALAPSNISLVIKNTKNSRTMRTLDPDVKRSNSFALDASLTDLAGTQSPKHLNTERGVHIKF